LCNYSFLQIANQGREYSFTDESSPCPPFILPKLMWLFKSPLNL
jgi:hypothetical protein